MSPAVAKPAEVWQTPDGTCYLRVGHTHWVTFADLTIYRTQDIELPMRRLLDEEGRIAPERLLGPLGLKEANEW